MFNLFVIFVQFLSHPALGDLLNEEDQKVWPLLLHAIKFEFLWSPLDDELFSAFEPFCPDFDDLT